MRIVIDDKLWPWIICNHVKLCIEWYPSASCTCADLSIAAVLNFGVKDIRPIVRVNQHIADLHKIK